MVEQKRPAEKEATKTKKPKLITEFFSQSKKFTKKSDNGSEIEKTTTSEHSTGKSHTINENKAKVTGNGKGISEEVGNKTIGLKSGKTEGLSNVSSAKVPDHITPDITPDTDYSKICEDLNFDKQEWLASLSDEHKLLLDLEISTLHISWLAALHKELTKPYFLRLKRFLNAQKSKTVFPPAKDIYSWSHYTPLPEVKCLVLGQDPYHNFNQAHGLAFSVLEPTRPPPSLLNIYKTLKIDFPNFEIPDYKVLAKQGEPGGGNLTKWAKRGVLMLNACLTVEAHKANSHAKQGWELFTEQVIKAAITHAKEKEKLGFVIMAWGTPAQKRIANFTAQLNSAETPFLVLKSVHPSPLSASRGFFELEVFKKCNKWLEEQGKNRIDWGLFEGNVVTGE